MSLPTPSATEGVLLLRSSASVRLVSEKRVRLASCGKLIKTI